MNASAIMVGVACWRPWAVCCRPAKGRRSPLPSNTSPAHADGGRPAARTSSRAVLSAAESVAPEHPGHAHFLERYKRVRQGLAEGVEHAQAAGQLRSDLDARIVAILLAAVMDGQRPDDPGSVPPTGEKELREA